MAKLAACVICDYLARQETFFRESEREARQVAIGSIVWTYKQLLNEKNK